MPNSVNRIYFKDAADTVRSLLFLLHDINNSYIEINTHMPARFCAHTQPLKYMFFHVDHNEVFPNYYKGYPSLKLYQKSGCGLVIFVHIMCTLQRGPSC